LLCAPGARCRRRRHRRGSRYARSGIGQYRIRPKRAAAQDGHTPLQGCRYPRSSRPLELLRTMRAHGIFGGTRLALPDSRVVTRSPAPPDGTKPSYGGPMLVFSDPTSTLCTAVVAGFAFGLLLLGNRRR